MTMPMPAILTQFRHPYSFPAYRAMKAAHAAGDVTNAEWAAYDEEIHVDGGSWLGFMRWNRNGVAAMPEDRTDDYLSAIDDAAADFWAATDDDAGHAPGFDEWNALRLAQGQRHGSFTEYMREIAPMLAREESGS